MGSLIKLIQSDPTDIFLTGNPTITYFRTVFRRHTNFSLELKEDGTGMHNRDGSSYKVKWSIKGNEFTMTETFAGLSIDYNGTLKDGKLDIFNGDKNDDFTYEYVYEKQ